MPDLKDFAKKVQPELGSTSINPHRWTINNSEDYGFKEITAAAHSFSRQSCFFSFRLSDFRKITSKPKRKLTAPDFIPSTLRGEDPNFYTVLLESEVIHVDVAPATIGVIYNPYTSGFAIIL